MPGTWSQSAASAGSFIRMAANSEAKSAPWRSPLSTAITKDKNAPKDTFQHLEKLLASAVSICRLNGTVQCQTGGLITVCEEMQRLLRCSFSGK